MENFNYSIKTVTPSTGSRGERIMITAHLTDIIGEVKNVFLSVPQYGVTETFKLQEEGTYSLSYTIPWEAPSGNYNVQIYAVDKDYKRGPFSTFNFSLS